MAKDSELGHGGHSDLPWDSLADSVETVPNLQWPLNIRVYDQMRNDAMLAGVLMALTLPIRRYRWYIDPNGARDKVVDLVANNFNLPIQDADPGPKRRTRDRFSHDRHLFTALLSLVYGHQFFEQVYRYENADKSGRVPRGTAPGRLMIRKLAPRMPLSIAEILVARDGGLEGIKQHPAGRTGFVDNRLVMEGINGVKIPTDRLVAYVHDQEGGNWRGASILRRSYKNWLIKDKLMRIDVIRHERTGAGVPIIEAPPNATPAEIQALSLLAQRYRVGEASGGAIPHGAKLRLVGVEGATPDVVGSIRYQDQQMTAGVLAMFMQLGTTETGSRALGESMTDFFSLSQETIANEYVSTTNEHVIEDLVDENWGPDEAVPLLAYERDDDPSAAVVDLVALTNAGLIEPDDELRTFVRTRYKLPEAPEVDPDDTSEVPAAPKLIKIAAAERAPKRERLVVHAAEGDPPEVGNREPLPHELTAGTDFAAIEAAYAAALAALVSRWMLTVKPAMVDELVALIEQTDPDDELALATLTATPRGEDVVLAAMVVFAAIAMASALDEARHQGVELEPPDTEALEASLALSAAALAAVMAKSLSEAANRHALSQVGAGLAASDLAKSVRQSLDDLTDAFPKKQMAGALSRAQGQARFAVMEQADSATYYASEVLDSATCGPCGLIDGERFADLSEARKAYPSGYYRACDGGSNCRGLVVPVYGT